MKEALLIVTLLLSLQACDPIENQSQKQENYSKFDLFVKRFQRQNPDMGKNDILRNEGNQKFKDEVLHFFNDSTGVSYVPLNVVSINEYNDGKYIVHMQNDDDYEKNDISEFSHIDFFVITTKTVAKALSQNKVERYLVKSYRNVRFLDAAQLHSLTTDLLWSPGIDLKTDNDNTRVDGNDYGNYLVEADEIKHI
ncbi:MAG: hypothetical protein JST50_12770 [Bacteroidetes bacterium]|jgi:hypothetical protein|nr:hypothetical protein [Bacteroidota bacterium]